jgi:hypothetical protein
VPASGPGVLRDVDTPAALVGTPTPEDTCPA